MSEQSISTQSDNQATVEYRDIPGFPGYRIGTDGSLWSAQRRKHFGSSRIGYYNRLSGCIRQDGYVAVSLSRSSKSKTFLLHYLVLLAFVGPRPDGMVACHNNGIKSDNRPSNLRYDTQKGNMGDKVAHGTLQKGEDIVQAKITEREVGIIRSLVDQGVYQEIVAEAFGISRREVGRIYARQRWQHLE